MTKNGLHFFFFAGLLLLFYACAQVVSPSGGEKDTKPPEVLESEPFNGSNQFEAQKIRLQFDEFVKLNQLKQQLIVSPPLKHDLKTQLKGKSLVLELEDTLKANTTYVMNFGDAIVDITENNPMRNFQYVFSTGEFIDSLKLSGQVVDAFSLEADKEILVMLYNQIDSDSLAYNYLPSYLGRSDEDGYFTISNIAEGKYKVVALKDANSNFLFDRADEKIAFLNEAVNLPNEVANVRLFSFNEASEKQFVDQEIWKGNQLILVFKKPVVELNYSFLEANTNEMLIDYYINQEKDSAFFWFKELHDTRLKFTLQDESSALSDTLSLKFDSLPLKKGPELMNPMRGRLPFFKRVPLQFNRPIKAFDTALIRLTQSNSTRINYSIEKDPDHKNRLYLVFDKKQDSSYFLQLLPGAFTDEFNRTLNDSLNKKITISQEKDYGLLELQLEMEDMKGPFIVQLTDTKGKIIREKTLSDKGVKFTYLKGGNYGLKLIQDGNENGHWDTGDYAKEMLAEKIYIYDEVIQIRSNWDKEIKWIIR